ncbi:MAG: hypothetical protein HYV03_07395 [Deltaproteobacteria bacterium]|nr:hypothetical protein [Deltaproteobacteria bacterium]
MTIGSAKTSTFIPGVTTSTMPQAKAVATPEVGADPILSAFQSAYGPAPVEDVPTTTPSTAPAGDPFAWLRATFEGSGGLPLPSTPAFTGEVPQVEELVALSPSLQSFGDGTVPTLYTQLKQQVAEVKAALEKKLDGLLPTSMIQQTQQRIKTLDTALTKIDVEAKKAEALKTQAIALWEREVAEELPKALLGEIPPEAADLDGNGFIGNPKTTDYVIGFQIIDGEKLSAIVQKSTKKPPAFDPSTGLPLATSSGVFDTDYQWAAFGEGVSLVGPSDDGYSGLIGTDFTVQLDQIGAHGVAGNYLNVQIDMAVPEYIWVKKGDDGEPTENEHGRLEIKSFNPSGLGQEPPNAAEQNQYMQVKITDVLVSSDKPADWPAGKQWTEADGKDHVITFKAKDQEVLRIRIAGRQATAAEQAKGSEAARYVHNGFIAASSTSLAFNGDQRVSPIHLEADSSFLSTGTHFLEPADFAALGIPNPPAGSKEAKAMAPTLNAVGGHDKTGKKDVSGYTVGTNRFGVAVTGLYGMIELKQFNNIVDVPELAGEEEAQRMTIVKAGEGYNIVRARGGNHDISGATLVQIDGQEGDENFIKTAQSIQQTELDPKTGAPKYNLIDGSNKNALPVYVAVHTPGGITHIGNQVDQIEDDYYQIDSGEVAFAYRSIQNDKGSLIVADPDAPANATGDANFSSDFDSLVSDHEAKILELIKAEQTTDADGEWGYEAGIEDAEYYNAVTGELNDFFGAFAAAFGLTDGEKEPEPDVAPDDEKPLTAQLAEGAE